MLVLGIETSTNVSSVALGSEQGIVASTSLSRGKGHAEFLIPAVKFLCEESEVALSQLAGIAVGVGPGLFTGMRVGVATAKTIAQALGVPLVGIASLDLLAFEIRYTPKLICACIDARRGEVFCAFYRQVPGGVQRVSDYVAWPPQRLAAEIEARVEEVLFIGNGALLYKERLPKLRTEYAAFSRAFPQASALVELALPRFFREETDSLYELEPLYIRKADAQIAWEERGVVIQRPGRVKTRKREGER
ncbi:MAG: tRNA (adenosine(37)-N6)-threonylcarbamoyltransferase complex dimerization subunit type 1 TsaB [Actinomycetota bacterium]|nr:tRNA (adenosine(37)-N6)-threonylcarbamoyltransferase complex dimerization subunit type 1 TsaB [Actinomycetota bacterium]